MSCRSRTITVSIGHRLKGWPVGPISWLNHFQCGHGHEYQMQPHKFQYIKTWFEVWLIVVLERKEKNASMSCLLQLSGGVGKPCNFWKMTCTKIKSLNCLSADWLKANTHYFFIFQLFICDSRSNALQQRFYSYGTNFHHIVIDWTSLVRPNFTRSHG